jgi:hypothetical protein
LKRSSRFSCQVISSHFLVASIATYSPFIS